MCGSSIVLSMYFSSLAISSLFLGGERKGKNETRERAFVDGSEVAHIREYCVTGPHPLAGNARKYVLQLSSPKPREKGRILEGWLAVSATGLNKQRTKCQSIISTF